ncbi:patatin [Arthrobacter livingstonensis]|uniref:Patatin n=1 Tax=Arthrobacter livingstonensis TaxID=670078 RepID=A0A2V5LA08_9MICC|nr:patatin-like phospholipase family protein [Arthrobacter livingstonensis]PYI67284.1 patatin [Arthrobacter livingstonensis]
MKRSLVLAGGGMRVAWQAGVVKALADEGLEFDHVDGTSGGILTTAMLLSGVAPDEMIRRWRDVNVRNFSSALPLRDYLKGPWNLPALSDADGIVNKLFPALGIDAARIRAGSLEGSFNVANFTDKRSIALDARDVDAELLAAGMSLPLFMTPLKRDGVTWTDAAWIRDANVTEALRRGAEEVWLVWCVGNSPYWGDGPLEQYVHMIEMSASGGLLFDFAIAEAAGREFVLHVVKPAHPLPLDPDFYLGRIDALTLIGMGYRDAVAYLSGRAPAGVPADYTCTKMTDPPPGVRWTEKLSSGAVRALLTVWLPSEKGLSASVTGFIENPQWAHPAPLADGRLVVSDAGDSWTYAGRIRVDGEWVDVAVERHFGSGGSPWHERMNASLQVGADRLDVRLGVPEAASLLASIEPFGAHGVFQRVNAVASVVQKSVRGLRH